MRTPQVVGLLAVGALLVGALAYGTRTVDDAPPTPPGPDLVRLRDAAGLESCPAGLTPELPDLTLDCLGGGEPVRVQDPPGRPTLVNVWATWCPPCVDEVPLLVDFHEAAGDKVGLVGVLTEDSLDSALQFAAATGLTYPNVVDDDGAVLRQYAPGPPLTLFVRADGTVAYVKAGPFEDLAEIKQLTREKLDVDL